MLFVVLIDSVRLGLAGQEVDRYHLLKLHPSFALFLSRSIGLVCEVLNVSVE